MLSGLWRRLSGRPDAAPVPVRSGGGLLALGGPVTPRVGSSDDERIDTPLLLVAAALVLFGVVMVYSASITLADSPRYKVTPTHFLVRHLFAIAVAMSFAIAAFSVPMARWQKLAPAVFGAAFVLLVLVLLPGVGTGALGARRWIPLGILNLQPSELMKVACVLYAASFTVRKQDYMHSLKRGFLPIGLVMLGIGWLLQLQPDLGAFLVIVAIAMGILFLGGLNGRLFVAITVLLAAGLAAIVWLFPYRRERIFAYLDPCRPRRTVRGRARRQRREAALPDRGAPPSPAWWRRASASGSACSRSSTSVSPAACCRPRASRCRW